MCAFKLPVDQEYAIRQSFAAFFLLTPLFFSEFLGSNDKGNGGKWWPGFKIGGMDPVAPQRATGPCRPSPLFFFSRDFVANLKKKIAFEPCRPP